MKFFKSQDRWREKYYDKTEELRVAEEKVEHLREAVNEASIILKKAHHLHCKHMTEAIEWIEKYGNEMRLKK